MSQFEPPAADDARDPVEELAELFLADVRQGKPTTVEEFQRRYPEHADSIEALFPTLLMMEDLKPSNRTHDSADTLLERNVRRLGEFQIIRKLGFGGMGIVYEARQESLDRTVAVKVFAPTLLSSEQLIRRFKREAKAAGALHHSNIVPILGVGEQWGIHYYIMQLIDGRPLDQIIDVDRKHLQVESQYRISGDWERIAEIGRQLASALAYAHSRKVLHRDIKPANVLLDRDGTAWITDFGLAKLMTVDDGMTRTGHTVGTLRYMAPEQLAGEIDHRSDVYALGLTIYELLVKRRAFDETDHARLVRQKTTEIPPRPRSITKSIPRDLETIVLKATAVDPRNRYQSATALEEDLSRFLEDQPILARRVSAAERLWRWSRRNRALAFACASVLVLASVALGVFCWSYLSVQNALDGQRTESQRATATSTLATGALDSVFERFGIEPIYGLSPASQPMLSAEAATLLEDLLSYYEALALQDSNNPELMLKAAQSQATVGDIHQRLGNYDKAVLAYEDAIAKYERLPEPIQPATLAGLENSIGKALRLSGGNRQGRARHKQAILILQQSGTTVDHLDSIAAPDAALLELARSYYLLGTRLRPGTGIESMPPDSAISGASGLSRGEDEPTRIEALENAVRILQRIEGLGQPSPAARQLLAWCLRELVPDNLAQREPRETQLESRAIAILETLISEYPNHAEYHYDLGETLAEFTVFGDALNESVCGIAQPRLQRAIGIGETIVSRRPDVTSYQMFTAHAHFKQARVAWYSSEHERGQDESMLLDEADEHFNSAIDHWSTLAERFSSSQALPVWIALGCCDLVDVNLRMRAVYSAAENASYAIQLLEQLPAETRELPIVEKVLDLAYEKLRLAYGAMGVPPQLMPAG